ncbi:MAG: hypothetical protein ABEJ72_00935, partial [Candidatus Aenigmatarchaeota archaeon]
SSSKTVSVPVEDFSGSGVIRVRATYETGSTTSEIKQKISLSGGSQKIQASSLSVSPWGLLMILLSALIGGVGMFWYRYE